MAKKKKFRVFAKVVSYCYYDIEAKNAEEAEDLINSQMGDEIDGGDFIECDKGGDFIVGTSDIPTIEITNGTHKKK